jgi:hypothetical protein
VRIDETPGEHLLPFIVVLPLIFCTFTLVHLPPCSGINSLWLFIPTFGAHRVLSSKTTLTMPPRRFYQRLHSEEAPPQEPNNHRPLHQPTQTLSTIDKVLEHPTLENIPEVELHQPTHPSTSAAGPSQANGVATSSHTTGGAPHQSPM